MARIVYRHPETHYTVLRLDTGGPSSVTAVGQLHPLSEGEEIKVVGFWKTHSRYGVQLQIEQWEKIEPATLEGIERYLGCGLIKGIGPSYAKRLVEAFGLSTLRVLSEEPLRVLEVEGIGEVRARRIMEAWQEQRGMREVMIFLQGHGVSSSLALKIYRIYGLESINKVKQDPYALARDVRGIGFVLADRIAGSIGIRGDSPIRIEAGVLHYLAELAERGHCFALLSALRGNAASLLGVEGENIQIAVEKLAANGDVILQDAPAQSDTRVYRVDLYRAETRVAEAIRRILSTPSFLQEEQKTGGPGEKRDGRPRGSSDLLRSDLFASLPIALDRQQIEAARQALGEKICVITGGPGTGKTTLLISLLRILRRAKVSFALAAPTGRAAKRMTETAGEDATTIHRLLEYSPREGCFQRNRSNPLETDVVIIDEVSMVDITLMDHLLGALDPHSHLILIGDVDQLPSVGPGSVLKDLIESGAVPVAVLNRIFRQKEESLIVLNAHHILQGRFLQLPGAREQRDFDFLARETEEQILETIKEMVRDQIPQRLQIRPEQLMESVQILTPMHRGMLGTIQLNRELQTLLNPAGDALERGGFVLRLGDKIMQLRNNYDKGVFNGDIGRIAGINREEGRIAVDFDDKRIEYEADEVDELTLAYAISVHKSQGSEYPVVLVPLHTSHYLMLYRSILYTAVTRGKKLVVVVGSRKALAMAIRNVRVERRNTALKERLANPEVGS